jgi:hypothetical protein
MTMRFSFTVGVIAVALVLGTTSFDSHVAVASQQAPAAQGLERPTRDMQGMMKMHEQMMAEMKANDAKLDALVKDMNGATDDARTTAVIAVVNELARQHNAMHDQMGEMHQHMMGMMGGRGMMTGQEHPAKH